MIERADYERCSTCRFWDGEGHGELDSGRCCRFPPSVPQVAGEILGGVQVFDEDGMHGLLLDHPMTYAPEWCGEWRPDAETMAREGLV